MEWLGLGPEYGLGLIFLRGLGQIRIQVGGVRAKFVRVRIQCLGGA